MASCFCKTVFGLGIFLLLPTFGQAQSTTIFQGTILDSQTQQPLPYASLGVLHTSIGGVSNAEGSFRLEVSTAHATDTVLVQMLGYQPLKIRLRPALLGSPQHLTLRPHTYALQEVSVQALSPTSLIKKAVRQTMARMMSPVELHTYYREFASLDQRYFKFADGLVDYFLVGNPRRPTRPEVQARVRESRVGQTSLTKEQEMLTKRFAFKLSVTEAGDYYDVTEGSPYLDSTAFRFYTYSLQETPPDADGTEAPYYLLHCEPRTHAEQHLRRATVRIDRQSLCIQHIESEIPPELQRYRQQATMLMVTIRKTSLRKRLDYKEFNGRLYPSFVRLQRGWELRVVNKPPQQFEFTSELLVSGLGDAKVPFPKSERHQGTLSSRGTLFSHPYWQEGNIVPATPAEDAAIQQLDNVVNH